MARSDVAYSAYTFLGAVALWTARVTFPGPPAPGTGGYDAFVAGLGFLVVIPFGIPAVAALCVAFWLTCRLSRDKWLVALLLLTIAFIAYLFVWWFRAWFQWFPLFLYGATCVASGLWWFLFKRWRPMRDCAPEVAGSSAEPKRPA